MKNQADFNGRIKKYQIKKGLPTENVPYIPTLKLKGSDVEESDAEEAAGEESKRKRKRESSADARKRVKEAKRHKAEGSGVREVESEANEHDEISATEPDSDVAPEYVLGPHIHGILSSLMLIPDLLPPPPAVAPMSPTFILTLLSWMIHRSPGIPIPNAVPISLSQRVPRRNSEPHYTTLTQTSLLPSHPRQRPPPTHPLGHRQLPREGLSRPTRVSTSARQPPQVPSPNRVVSQSSSRARFALFSPVFGTGPAVVMRRAAMTTLRRSSGLRPVCAKRDQRTHPQRRPETTWRSSGATSLGRRRALRGQGMHLRRRLDTIWRVRTIGRRRVSVQSRQLHQRAVLHRRSTRSPHLRVCNSPHHPELPQSPMLRQGCTLSVVSALRRRSLCTRSGQSPMHRRRWTLSRIRRLPTNALSRCSALHADSPCCNLQIGTIPSGPRAHWTGGRRWRRRRGTRVRLSPRGHSRRLRRPRHHLTLARCPLTALHAVISIISRGRSAATLETTVLESSLGCPSRRLTAPIAATAVLVVSVIAIDPSATWNGAVCQVARARPAHLQTHIVRNIICPPLPVQAPPAHNPGRRSRRNPSAAPRTHYHSDSSR
jgi:hypothetical protein